MLKVSVVVRYLFGAFLLIPGFCEHFRFHTYFARSLIQLLLTIVLLSQQTYWYMYMVSCTIMGDCTSITRFYTKKLPTRF